MSRSKKVSGRRLVFEYLETRRLLTLVLSPINITASTQTEFNGVVATLVDTTGADSPSSFTTAPGSVQINWGDGASTVGQVVGPVYPGVFEVEGAHPYTTDGGYSTQITVFDQSGNNAIANGSATVTSQPPQLVVAGQDVAGTAGSALLSVPVATFLDTNTSDTQSQFLALITWGDGNASIGTVAGSHGTFTVTGSNTYEAAGTYPINVTILDTANSASAVAMPKAQIGSVPNITASGTTFSTTPGTPLPVNTIVANFTDLNTQANATNIAAVINWGDSQTTTGTVNATGTPGDYAVTGSHDYPVTVTSGSYPVIVTIADPDGVTVMANSTALVTSYINATGTSFSAAAKMAASGVTVANFTDTNPMYVNNSSPTILPTAVINWGDGQTSSGTVTLVKPTASGGNFTVTGTHTYSAPAVLGFYVVTATILDPSGQSSQATGSAFVTPAAAVVFSATGTTFTATPGVSLPATTVVANLTDANPTANLSNINATINWGDGQTTSGAVNPTGTPDVYTVTGSHTYSATGSNLSYPVSVTITDPTGTTTATSTAVIASFLTATGTTFTMTPSVPLAASTVVANFTDDNPSVVSSPHPASLISAIINWGDGQTSPGTINFTSGTASSDDFTVTGSHVYAAGGSSSSYTVSVTIIDPSGQTIAVNSTALVATYSIVASGTTFATTPGAALINQTVATFTDANPGAASSTAVINWGDGTTVQGTVSATGSPGVYTVSGTHTYSASGSAPSHAVMVTIVDPSGQTATANSTAVVAPSPSSSAPFAGMLADLITNGPHAAEGFTNTNRPTFSGTAPAYSVVQLYARHFNVDAQLPLGEAVADANGNWTYTTGPLAVGTYIITATYTIPGGYPSNTMTLTNQVANPRTGADDLVYIDLSPRLVKWLSHGQKTSSEPQKTAKAHPTGHHKMH